MGRRLAVRAAAFALRHGVAKFEVTAALRRAFRHRDNGWCEQVTDEAMTRNARKLANASG